MAGGSVLQKIPVAARSHNFPDNVVVGGSGHDDDSRTQCFGPRLPYEFDPVNLWQVQIHDGDMRPETANSSQRTLAVCALRNDLEARCAVQHRSQTIPAQRILVREKNSDFVVCRHGLAKRVSP